LLQPLLNQSLVPLLRTMQRLLAGNAELRQKPPNRHRAQDDMEQLRDHLACPQRKRELQLQRVFLRHSGVNPPQLLAVELRRASRQGLRLQTIPAATPVSHQPSVYGRPVDTKNTSDDLWTFAIMNTLHRAHAHLFQRLMIQLSRVVFSHAGTESIPVHAVKQNIELLMNGLIIRIGGEVPGCWVQSLQRPNQSQAITRGTTTSDCFRKPTPSSSTQVHEALLFSPG